MKLRAARQRVLGGSSEQELKGRGCIGLTGGDAAAELDESRLVLADAVHLFDPTAKHHEVLAREGKDAVGPGE